MAVDETRQVEIEIILLDLREAHHAGEFGNLLKSVEGIDNFVNVLRAEAVLRAVLYETSAGVDHEDAFAGIRVLLVDHHDTGRNAGPIKKVRRQADDSLDVALSH